MLEQDHQFTQNHQYATQLKSKLTQSALGIEIPALDNKHFRQLLNKLIETGQETEINAHTLLTNDWVGITDLEKKLDVLIDFQTLHQSFVQHLQNADAISENMSLRDQLMSVAHKYRAQQEKTQQQLNNKKLEVQRLENSKVSYPAYVEAAITAIQQQCPQANPCVLCDFIDIIDPEWQMAIEGYIGGARFSIVVNPDFEAEVIRIVKGIKGRRNNARVIQGGKAQRDAARMSLPVQSIIELMQFEHKIVEYYMIVSYGAVVRVNDENTLRKTARGLMSKGLGSGNYSMFRCDLDDADLVFGQKARQRALQAKQTELLNLQQKNHMAEEEYRHIARLAELIDGIKPVYFADIVRDMLALYHDLQAAETRLATLDLTDFKEFEHTLQQLQLDRNEVDATGRELERHLGELNAELKQLTYHLTKLANERETLQNEQEEHEQAVFNIAQIYPEHNSHAALQLADDKAQQANNDFSFDGEIEGYRAALTTAERALHEIIVKHNQVANAHQNIVYLFGGGEPSDTESFKYIVATHKDIESVCNSLQHNVLVGKHEQLSDLKDSFNTAFVTNLCHSIYQSINDGKRILEDLNAELQHHRFGADQERFYFAYRWIPEFQEYQRFFKEIIDVPNLGDGSTLFDIDLSDKSCQIRDKLLDMLLANDEQYALRELRRISDYRHYREYEIYKKPYGKEPIALSTYGTGSGGQLETPAYIIRSAAITSAFKFNEGNTHCRMVLVDEAFSKMDESRSREVIHYLTEQLGLQLIFIMPTSKSGPFMDLISHQTVFSKCPTRKKIGELESRVLVDRKTCNQDKIKQLWANHRRTIRDQGMLDFMEDIV